MIDSEANVRISIATHRTVDSLSPPGFAAPRLIYCLCPIETLRNAGSASANVSFVAATAVFPLEVGGEVTVDGEAGNKLGTNGRGTYLYRDVWGSQLYPYDVTIRLAPGLVPVNMAWDEEPKNLVGTTVALGKQGFKIRIANSAGPRSEVRGVGVLDLYFINNAGLWDVLRRLPMFADSQIGFAEFFTLMHLLSKTFMS